MKGKRFFALLTLLLLSTQAASAQLLFGIGYQQGFFNMKNANIPVDRFNDRGFLTKELGKFHWPGGEIYSVSLRQDRLLLDLNLNTRRARISAESFSGNQLQRRDTRFSMQAISLGAGYAVSETEEEVFYLGGAIDAGFMRLLTRFGAKETINRQRYGLWSRSPVLSITLFGKWVFRGSPESIAVVSLTPYVQLPLSQFDFVPLNQILNAATWVLDPQPLLARPLNFGLALNFDIDLLRLIE